MINKKERISLIMTVLDGLYPEAGPSLNFKSVYTLLIAVLLSAQCTDKRVNIVTKELFDMADNPFDMVKLTIDDIEKIIHSCGLAPTKAKAIWNLSKIIVESYNGNVPQTFEELEKLPGVGHKTASVIMAFGFNKPAFPVDTHVHRCAKRWGLTEGKTVRQTEKDLKKLVPEKEWKKLHLQIIKFGREHCKASPHDTSRCPVCSLFSD